MYYSIKGKMFLYNYTKIILKLDNNTSISIFGNVLIKDINRDKVTSFQQIFNLSNLNSEIKATLTEIKNFTKSPKELRKYSRYCDIGDSLNILHRQFIKNKKYNLKMNLFIFNSLFNYIDDVYFDVDLLGDYFSNHYTNNAFLIISMDLNSRMLIDSKFTIVNCGKDLIEYKSKSFDAIFPLSVRKIAIERFIAELSNNDQNNISIFDLFLFQGKQTKSNFLDINLK